MLNNISKRIPVVALVATVGVIGIGVIGQQTKLVLSSQTKAVPTSTELMSNVQNSVKTPLLQRLREIRAHRSEVQTQTTSQDLKTEQTNKADVLGNEKSLRGMRTAPKANFPQKDGVYLYGQSPEPNEIGQGYIIFEKRRDQIKGALYMPSSEFSCFQGTLDSSGELAMTVTGFPGEGSATEVASRNGVTNVADEEAITYAYSVALQDYHPINSISFSDRQILQMCKQSPTGGEQKLVK